jgi:hypothetical protein
LIDFIPTPDALNFFSNCLCNVLVVHPPGLEIPEDFDPRVSREFPRDYSREFTHSRNNSRDFRNSQEMKDLSLDDGSTVKTNGSSRSNMDDDDDESLSDDEYTYTFYQ